MAETQAFGETRLTGKLLNIESPAPIQDYGNAELRYQHIQEHAKFVDDVDI